MPVNITLPHTRQDAPKFEPPEFTTLDAEMARAYSETHPHYGEADSYGNKGETPKDVDTSDK